MQRLIRHTIALLSLPALACSASASACACGCGVFQVGTSSQMPTTFGSGTTWYAQLNYLDQSGLWSGDSRAPSGASEDRQIRTVFGTVGMMRMFNRNWGLRVDLPYWSRRFVTTGPTDQPVTFNHAALGDIRISGIYTGFSPDRSSGLTFGVKLPTGDWTYPGFDRDTQIGSGTTDLLVGGYHQWKFGSDGRWSGFVQATTDLPANRRDGYRPGAELDAAVGVYTAGWTVAGGLHVTPILQTLVAVRGHDTGPSADPDNTGYRRLLAAPGIELQWRHTRLDVRVARPLYQHVRGNQLVAPWQASLSLSWTP